MKKLSVIAVIAVFLGFLTSCKQHEKCPAYGKNEYKSMKKHS